MTSHHDSKEKKVIKKQDPSEFFKFPPVNQKEFKAVLIEYLLSTNFDYPIPANDLYEELIQGFQTRSHTPFLKNLQIKPILMELAKNQAIDLQQLAVGTQLMDFILSITIEKLKQLYIEFSKDKPRKIPTYDEWIKEETQSFQQGMVEKIESIMDPSNSKTSQITILPKIAAQKKKYYEEIDKKKNKSDLKLKYDESIVQLVLERKKMKIQSSDNHNEEEARRKFMERGIQICEYYTRDKCNQNKGAMNACSKTHFKQKIRSETQKQNGNCQYLDQCRQEDTCQHIHYMLDTSQKRSLMQRQGQEFPAQWINCDLRVFDFRILGKYQVIMADPPWDIHMNLPYGTLKDKEMKALRVDLLQDDGLIFLWVTGRAMELGRECLQLWGYKRMEELVWIKVNQMHRIIRTGRTGHWLNHSKEHCLVGMKGNPQIVRALDCDLIVSEVRETSRKPDEIYGMIQRMSPYGRYIELFGRPHNCRPNWITLGNQLPGVYIKDQSIVDRNRFTEAYPTVDVSQDKMEQNLIQMMNEENLNTIYNNHIVLNKKMIQQSEQDQQQQQQQQQLGYNEQQQFQMHN